MPEVQGSKVGEILFQEETLLWKTEDFKLVKESVYQGKETACVTRGWVAHGLTEADTVHTAPTPARKRLLLTLTPSYSSASCK